MLWEKGVVCYCMRGERRELLESASVVIPVQMGVGCRYYETDDSADCHGQTACPEAVPTGFVQNSRLLPGPAK